MPQIYIDGKMFETQTNKTVLQTAVENGVHIPHFCWHPELSVSGNCRMCLVEIGMPKKLPDGSFEKDSSGKLVISYLPKLQIACATQVTDGMHIRTQTESVVHAQESVMEFFLINHPLDCPICDEAGQCKLQEYAFNHSPGHSRFEEVKNPKDKRQSWGPNVLYDAERCISCSRCIRFAQEVAKQDVLTFVQRGDHVTIELFNGTTLDSPYSMNVIDICPVGALTSKDFRFKSRVWDMSFNDSICTGCARGCNIKIGVRNNEILRVEPKANHYVNKYWMCDHGRLSWYKSINENRISNPLIKSDDVQTNATWEEAINKASKQLSQYKPDEIMFLGAAGANNEDNYLLSQLAKRIFKSGNVDFYRYFDENFGDNLLKVSDTTPNSNGAIAVGVVPVVNKGKNISSLVNNIRLGNVKVLYSIDGNIEHIPGLIDVLNQLELFIIHQSNFNKVTELADIVFATSTCAETDGTFTNIENRVQHYTPALVTSENIRFMGMKMSRLDKFGAPNDRWTSHELKSTRQNWQVLQSIANTMNAGWKYIRSEQIFNELASNIELFKDMNYGNLDEYQGLKLGMANKPDPKVKNYKSHYMKPD